MTHHHASRETPRHPIVASLCRALLLSCLLLPAACTVPQRGLAAPVTSLDTLVLLSIDAMRAKDLDPDLTPNLVRLAREGVQADWMTPSYPSLTFPNHYTLVTGLRPDHHGIVHNTMRDATLGGFKVSDEAAVTNAAWWAGGEPIWTAAERAGLGSAVMFWPGSEADHDGLRPRQYHRFDYTVTADARVDQLLQWMDLPAATRPRLLLGYFDKVDSQAHAFGPHSPEARTALRDTDAAIGRLMAGIDARGLSGHVNLVVVSDHGMADVPPGNVIAVEDMVTVQQAVVVSVGQSIGIAPHPGQTAIVEQRLLGRHAHYACWRKAELPPQWHYGSNPRVPPIVCQMDENWDALARETIAGRAPRAMRGSHGYDPALPSMRAMFIVRGPAFKVGARIPGFDNVDVYPLLAGLLGITPAPNDGDARTLRATLKREAPTAPVAP